MITKIKIFKIILSLCFCVILSRVFYLQIIEKEYYLEKLSSYNNKIVYENPSLRGRIYDRNNKLLVDNQLVLTIVYKRENKLTPKEEFEIATLISPKINLDYQKLTKSYLKDFYLLMNNDLIEKRVDSEIKENLKKRKISNNEYYQIKKNLVNDEDLMIYSEKDKKAIYLYYLMNNGYSYMEKVIKENCTPQEFMYFAENNNNLYGFNISYKYGRKYLYGDTFKGILGNIGSLPEDKKDYYLARGYSLSDQVGLSNIEFVYDDLLKSGQNMYLITKDEKILLKDATRGKDLKLTIDINLQKYVDDVLTREIKKAKKAYNTKYYNHSYVLISDTYGNILSMNGKEFINGKIVDIPIGNITDTITAGSVVKAASMIVGYSTGAIKIGEIQKDECIKIKGTKKKCSVYTMGNINDINALAYSSNVYQFKTAMKVAGAKYHYDASLKINDKAFDIYRDYFNRFGLGVSTGIELLNESKGYKGIKRDPGLLLNFAIGQYDTYTNIQLNQYISTIARDGERYKMHLLDSILDNGKIIEKKESVLLNKVNVPKKYLDRVKKGLKAVTSYGSGKNYVNIDASGKTGTSESFYDRNSDGKIDTETISTNFVMYTPSINPKVAISINSPNISTPKSGYKYPINQIVIKEITNNLYKFIN